MVGLGANPRFCGAVCGGTDYDGALISSEPTLSGDVALINVDGDPDLARRIAAKLDIAVSPTSEPIFDDDPPQFLLQLNLQGLSIQHTAAARQSPVLVDFVGGKAAYRRGQSEMIAQAIGVAKYLPMTVVDATAGLGRDAFVLASRGCDVTMIERNPIIHALLNDGLRRALAAPSTRQAAQRMTLINTDAVTWLQSRCEGVDAVYLDPMFPASNKTAAVKKEMQLLHHLLSGQSESTGLLEAARHCAKRRVVVKRGLKAKPLSHHSPSYSVKGRSTRFDVYLAPVLK